MQYETDGHDEVTPPKGTPTTYFPWSYPGSAPVIDSCGVTAGGNSPGQRDPPPGVPPGKDGLGIPGSKKDSKYTPELLDKTTWKRGGIVEVAWGISANHGGGYQYRLCPKQDFETMKNVEEECFQKHVLPFVGDKQWIQWGNGYNRSQRDEIKAVRVGGDLVKPKGKEWTRNPIPGCALPGSAREKRPCHGPAFTPAPLADRKFPYAGKEEGASTENGIFGYSGGHCMGNNTKAIDNTGHDVKCTDEEYKDSLFDFGIVDLVQVPDDLAPGEYVLSFRWDCEQTKQIWNSCADVTIIDNDPNKFETKPFSKQRGCTPCWKGLCAHCEKCLNNKKGECEDCWKPILWWGGVDFWTPRSPHIQCLGNKNELLEAADGGPGEWMPGDSLAKAWSPGCRKCWKDPESKNPAFREPWAGIRLTKDIIKGLEVRELKAAGSSVWPAVAAIEFILLLVAAGAAVYLYMNKGASARSFQEQRNDPVVPEVEMSGSHCRA
jgi:hypothetical protein